MELFVLQNTLYIVFPYGERSDVPRLQQVEQKAVGRQRNLGLMYHMTLPMHVS